MQSCTHCEYSEVYKVIVYHRKTAIRYVKTFNVLMHMIQVLCLDLVCILKFW